MKKMLLLGILICFPVITQAAHKYENGPGFIRIKIDEPEVYNVQYYCYKNLGSVEIPWITLEPYTKCIDSTFDWVEVYNESGELIYSNSYDHFVIIKDLFLPNSELEWLSPKKIWEMLTPSPWRLRTKA
ncbi:MAG: hypothetical protein NT116_06070 [Candidatus Parcubacteria bacterium]|nr:hypothetical protein [Candidatus Parcubacteria bacterium]